jgi:hypothetical protein
LIHSNGLESWGIGGDIPLFPHMSIHISAVWFKPFPVAIPCPAVWKKIELMITLACLLGQAVAFSRRIHRLSGPYTDA